MDVAQYHRRVEDLHVAGCIEVALTVAIYDDLFCEHIPLDGGVRPDDELSALDDVAVELALYATRAGSRHQISIEFKS